tara:strand:- start:331 stop:1032 length:702 start_codon:yes stop_codon:yes gene_type:complete
MGKMKRADLEKQIAGQGAITESGATGKSKITEGKIAGAKLVTQQQAANIMAGINEDEKNDLLTHAQEVTGKKDIRALSMSQLNEYYKKRELELKEIKAKTDRITAETKKDTDKSAAPYLTRLNETIATKLKYKIKDGKPMIGDKFLKGKDAEEWAATVAQAQNVFLAAAKGKATSNKSYNKSLSIANRFIKGELGDITELKRGDKITPDKIYITNRGLVIGNKKGTQLVPYEG